MMILGTAKCILLVQNKAGPPASVAKALSSKVLDFGLGSDSLGFKGGYTRDI